MSSTNFPENRLVLFLSRQCEACAEVQRIIQDVTADIDWDIKWVTPSRKGLYQLVSGEVRDYPILFRKKDLPAVPALHDPTLSETVFGVGEITKYLKDTGLLETDY